MFYFFLKFIPPLSPYCLKKQNFNHLVQRSFINGLYCNFFFSVKFLNSSIILPIVNHFKIIIITIIVIIFINLINLIIKVINHNNPIKFCYRP